MTVQTEKNVSVKELTELLSTSDLKVGKAFAYLDRMCNWYYDHTALLDDIEHMAEIINYSVDFYSDGNLCSKDELLVLSTLLFQKISEVCPSKLLSPELIECQFDVLQDNIIKHNALSRVLNALKTIGEFYESHDMRSEFSLIEAMISRLAGMPVVQLKAISSIMSEYMFELDSKLFGIMSNDSSTVGALIDDSMIANEPLFALYDYAAFMSRARTYGPARNSGIAILFKCDGFTDDVQVDFKAYRKSHISERCVSYGRFVGDFGSITINIKYPDRAQKDICANLSEYMARFIEFLKHHPEADSVIGLNETPVSYGNI